MSNFKLVKTAAALALGASVVTSAVATTDASAASKYKIKSGKLVYAKSGKVVKGYVTYKSTVYKNGSKLTGLKGKTYYKAGKKATGTYKGAYYVKGAKKVTTGTYNKAYYVKGVKKVSTGLYASKYYKDGKLATGTYKGAYYVKGLKKVTTGTYNGAYYVKGKKVVSTGLYADKLYVAGKLNKGYKLYKEDLYKDAVLNKGLVVFEGKLYDGAKLNEGHKIFKDELYNGSELNTKLALFEGKLYDGAKLNEGIRKFEDKWYNNAELADGTFTIDGKEVAIENGVEVGAKVKSVEAINGSEIKVTFNKAIKKSSVISTGNTLVTNIFAATALTTDGVLAAPPGTMTAVLSENGRELTLTAAAGNKFDGRYDFTVAADKIETVGGEKLENYSTVLNVKDTVKPTLSSVTYEDSATAYANFSEIIAGKGTVTAKYADGTDANVAVTHTSGSSKLKLDLSNVTADKPVTVTFVGITDVTGNILDPNPLTITVTKDSSDKTAPTVTSVTPTSTTTFDIKLSEKVKVVNATDIKLDTTSVTSAEVDANDPTIVHVEAATAVAADLATLTITAGALTDYSNNPIAAYTKVVNFKSDTTAPTVTSSVETINNIKYLVLNFNEDTTIVDGKKVTLTYKNSAGEKVSSDITVATTGTPNTSYYNNDTKKAVKIVLTGYTAASYDVTLEAGLFKDNFNNVNKEVTGLTAVLSSDTVQQSIKTTEDGNGIKRIDSNTLRVYFTKPLDVASAETVANYSVQGAKIAKAEINKNNSTDGYSVDLTLEAGTVKLDGSYEVKVSGVKALNGEALASTYTTTEALLENVAPVLSKVTLTGGHEITLTFNEDVKVTANAFDVYVGGTKLVTATNSVVSATGTKSVVLTVGSTDFTAAQLAAGLTIKSVDSSLLTDINDNKLVVPSTTVAQ
ncbi:hypothetical protein ASO14_2484 [Kurthia sp. 11kri321]|uniref:hypothetical protein n=1 Tax=Kurthia sp. 11kri321 TaxID=1750719 RepID=UPI000745EF80|nr:hypothetical protein [Kurthia sp. 11kri321]AMA64367.1 hypothetical protein ASO14_2484 [Kurthia sp. 11kri321]